MNIKGGLKEIISLWNLRLINIFFVDKPIFFCIFVNKIQMVMDRQLFAQRVKNARVMCGLTLDELCGKMGNLVSKQSLSKYEKGVMMPENNVIVAIAKALNVNLEYFFRPLSSINKVEFRKKSTLGVKKQEQVKECVRDIMERYITIEQLLGINISFQNPIEDIVVEDCDGVENVVRELRKGWWTGLRNLSNVVELLEDKGIKVLMVDFDKSFEGLSAWVNDNEFPVVVINRNMSVERIRFTAMHELGHLLLNIPSELPDKEKEKICHRFANAMLLPKEALFEEVGNKRRGIALPELIAIKEQYGISIAAVLMRMRDLGIINNSYYKNFYISHISKNRQEEKLGGYKGVEESNRFMMLLNRAVAEEVVSMSRAAELSNVKLSTFRSEYLSI